jgi:N-glycosylase/DNA lyase
MRTYEFPKTAFDARLTLVDSAQAFHWREWDGVFYSVSGGMALRVAPLGAGIRVDAPDDCPEDFVKRYFDLDRDYDAVARQYSDCPRAVEAFKRLPGLRILRQPPWEALVAFLLSQNNNTARIGKLVRALCERYGARHEAFGRTLYAFPEARALADAGAEALRALGAGYRAEYIAESARRVAEGFPLSALAGMSYDDARRKLQELPGVGPKVADCVLLFGCGHLSAYPVDVWVSRLSRAWLGIDGKNGVAVAEAARARFGPNAGILQQYLFHCARCELMT